MALNFNTDPYYDDYNEDKNFHRILFKPGVAVQARELTQLQTILQNQVARFGKNIFKPGSMVIPGSLLVDPALNYVKLLPTYNSVNINVNNYLNRELTGQTTGMIAKVLQVAAATDTDPPTLFVKYTNSGNNYVTTAFSDNEIITTSDTGTSYSATTIASASTGKCISTSISSGIFFVNDAFVKVQAQTIIIGKYASNASARVGLTITESIVTSDDDESLLDPAIGTYNYFAPGSDRYKILLTLDTRDIGVTPTTSDTFIELARVVDGVVTSVTKEPGYNLLADELARRTYDESGNYTVDPFELKVIEHLYDVNHTDGFLSAEHGGNEALGIAVLYPGKAYVKGYEVKTISNTYLPFSKPREVANVSSAVVQVPVGNYVTVSNVYNIPNFTSDYAIVNIYNQYTNAKGATNGTLVGNARVKGFETGSGNIMLSASTLNAYLFDIKMKSGYTFARDAKMLYSGNVNDTGYVSAAFSADIVPTGSALTGSITLTNNSNAVVGVNTIFNSELKVGDYIQFTSDSNSFSVASIISNTSLTIGRPYPGSNVVGVNSTLNNSIIGDPNLTSYVFPLANDVTTNVNSPVYSTRRIFYTTLSSGNVTLSTAVNTTFAARTDYNYFAVVQTGGNAGKLYQIGSSNFTYTDGTSRNIKVILNGYGLSSEDVLIYTTILKTNQTPKTKTSTDTSLTLTAKTDCQAALISLSTSDVYKVSNVRMSANVFGTAYTETNAVDITDRFILVPNQTPSYYGTSYLRLKSGAPSPSGPIRINYTYFDHGAGDYFTSASYPSYNYIPSVTINNRLFSLRDCLDFRPRLANDSINFKDTGAVRTEFLDFANNFLCNYDYYLPRTDKIYISSDGTITYKEGNSSLMPVEPPTPTDVMPLYTIKHPAYGFDISNYSTFIPLDQKRYTMKDIGKLDTRITNLEYYTTLSLLELDTTTYTVKDQFGLDRFKNGFVVDSFTGHGVGDVYNSDYNVSMNFKTGELLPGFNTKTYYLAEVNSTGTQRTANGYTLVNNTAIMLSYTDDAYISNNVASDDEHINPFDFYLYTGTVTLTPNADIWFDTTQLPIIYQDVNGVYDTLVPDAVGQKTYGSIWNSWKTLWFKPESTDAQSITTGVIFNNSTIKDSTSFVLPYMRAVNIGFTANKLKPLTRYYVFFNDYNVTSFCNKGTKDATSTDVGILISDTNGNLSGSFAYDPNTTGLKIPAGSIKFRVTDSPTNSVTKESFADAIFNATGTLQRIQNPYVNYGLATPVVTTGGVYSPNNTNGNTGSTSDSSSTNSNKPTATTKATNLSFAAATAAFNLSSNPLNWTLNGSTGAASLLNIVAAGQSVLDKAGLTSTDIKNLIATAGPKIESAITSYKATSGSTIKTDNSNLLQATNGASTSFLSTLQSTLGASDYAKVSTVYNMQLAEVKAQVASGTTSQTQLDFYNQKNPDGSRVYPVGYNNVGFDWAIQKAEQDWAAKLTADQLIQGSKTFTSGGTTMPTVGQIIAASVGTSTVTYADATTNYTIVPGGAGSSSPAPIAVSGSTGSPSSPDIVSVNSGTTTNTGSPTSNDGATGSSSSTNSGGSYGGSSTNSSIDSNSLAGTVDENGTSSVTLNGTWTDDGFVSSSTVTFGDANDPAING